MRNQPGLSWGFAAHINLVEVSPGYYEAVYFDNDRSQGEVIKTYLVGSCVEYMDMLKDMTIFNYNSCRLCPQVRHELSWQD